MKTIPIGDPAIDTEEMLSICDDLKSRGVTGQTAFDELVIRLSPLNKLMQQWIQDMVAADKVHDHVLDALLSRRWCHSYQFTSTIILHLNKLAEDGLEEPIDELMAEFTRRQLNDTLRSAIAKFPTRARHLSDAFDAHREGKFTLSVPALLPLIEGIGREVLGEMRQFYSKSGRTKALEALVETFKWPELDDPYPLGGVDTRMLSVLQLEWPMEANTQSRSATEGPWLLNRHGVLHGRDIDFDTEHNSLRCINHLGFLLDAHRVLHEDIPRHLKEMAQISRRGQSKAAAGES